MTPTRIHPHASIAIGLASALLLAGCSASDGDTTGADDSSAPHGAPTAAGSATVVPSPAAPPPPGGGNWAVRPINSCRAISETPDVNNTIYQVPSIDAECMNHIPVDSRVIVAASAADPLPRFGDPITVPGVEAEVHLVTPPELSRGQIYLVEPEGGNGVYLVAYNGGVNATAGEHIASLFAVTP